jgi:glycogen operon protein
VYNHTSEGNQHGPTLSWRGFGDSLYYQQSIEGYYQDVSGCGNTIAANRPLVRRLILESLRCWATELGVDGFRFDLGIALSRGDNLMPLEQPPLFEAMEADPELADLKLISEPWDCGGLYKLADFPARRVATWNGRFRDDVRRFWKGDENTAWSLGLRLSGSPDLYQPRLPHPGQCLTFLTAHDGFTLADLVSFNGKHNLANGEDNRDGDNHNNSWNHGVEGPTTDRAVLALRDRQMRNLLATLLLAPGVPMLLMGDEVRRSQGGNNNTWCQNNPLGWMHWQPCAPSCCACCTCAGSCWICSILNCPWPSARCAAPLNPPGCGASGTAWRWASPTGRSGRTRWPGASTTACRGPCCGAA